MESRSLPANSSNLVLYSDDYNPEKNYEKLLFLPGRVLQSRELNQIQTMIYDYLSRVSDAILKSGSIVEGCSISIENNVATISRGKIYINGLVRRVEETTINISGLGSEVIGAIVIDEVVTEADDSSLRDPAQGFENAGQPGAHRLRSVVKLVLNNPNAVAIYTLQDGNLVLLEEKPQVDVITDVLARRTYDESGNYKVQGLDMIDRNESDPSHIYVSLSEGKAYILGYEIIKPTSTVVKFRKSTETREVKNEPKTYTRGTSRYQLNNYPAKLVTQLVAQVEVTDTITRGNREDGTDYLLNSPVSDILEVSQGHTVYVKGRDYQLTADGVDWSLSGSEPAIGTTYKVKYVYNKILEYGVDYTLVDENENSYVDIKGGDTPVDNTRFTVSYEFYLARRDLVSLKKSGMIQITEGRPDIYRNLVTPSIRNGELLNLGSVLIHPNSKKIDILNYSTTRISMDQLHNIVKRMEELEYNQALSNLDEAAIDGENPLNLKGVLTDNFVGFSRSDTNHADYTSALDLDKGEVTLASDSDIAKLEVDTENISTSISYIGNTIVAPYEQEGSISQLTATTTMPVNPYAVFERMCPVTLTPAVDKWIEKATMIVEKSNIKPGQIRKWWLHQGSLWAENEKNQWEQTNKGPNMKGGVKGNTTTEVSTSTQVILDESIQYMRQIEIRVQGYNYIPNSDNIVCEFDGRKVNLVPTNPNNKGTLPGTVRADSKGYVDAKFMIPSGVPCGSKEVKLTSSTAEGSSVFTAEGRKIIKETTVLRTTIVKKPIDPLAQSFSFEEDKTLTSVDIYFASKDNSSPIIVQVRDMVAGYPGVTCYSETVLQASDINVSDDGSLATKVNFTSPVVCKANEQYCICILSDSNLYSVFISNLGEQDIKSKKFISGNPYPAGVLFSSSNALTWTAHQTSDLKFVLYTAKFSGRASIIFNQLSNISVDRLLLISDQYEPSGTKVDWYCTINGNPNWLPIDIFSAKELSMLANNVMLKAELKFTENLSPIISKDNLNIALFTNHLRSVYISKNFYLPEGFNNIKVIVDTNIPSGSNIDFYYSTDGTGSEWKPLTGGSTEKVDRDYFTTTYNVSLGDSYNNYRIKAVLSTSNSVIRPKARRLMNILKTV